MNPDADRLVGSDSEDSSTSSMSIEIVTNKKRDGEGGYDIFPENNIYDFDMETIRDKPWLKPGTDITDYFNYGFTESTWIKYCELQRENREFAQKHADEERILDEKRDESSTYKRKEEERSTKGTRKHW